MSIEHHQHSAFNTDSNVIEQDGDILPYIEEIEPPDYLKDLAEPVETPADEQLLLEFEEREAKTTPRELINPADKEDVWEGTGYSRPYDPSDMTTGQARTLRSQNIGGRDALRVAKRADDADAINASIGHYEGTQELTHDQQTANARRWEERTRSEMHALEIQLYKTPTPSVRARLENRKKAHQEAKDRLDRLELPGKVVELEGAIVEAQKRVDAAKYGISGRESNGRDLLVERRKRYIRRLGELGVTIETE